MVQGGLMKKGKSAQTAAAQISQTYSHPRILPPVHRRLRGYSLDPSLARTLERAPISEIVFRVRWEELEPGPVGRYLEVIDYDPVAKCFYAPVDLNAPFLLAQDGHRPSEGLPQFHQQMCYAVAQTTIQNFEHALGRITVWSPRTGWNSANKYDDSDFVEKLRIYPHALREANAYYSPAKKALLFGYFAPQSGGLSENVPRGMVFAALSHDIIAHETTHALLDGQHRWLNRPTNPDMLAFHEGFADIVALFQHFTFPEILRHEIANTRGEIRLEENLLGQLATEFGWAVGNRGALREYIGQRGKDGVWRPREPSPTDYETVTEPHDRGAILVAAIFDAFLSIYRTRVADLMRLYTGGTGVLPAGAIHPDLVERLSDEASKTAQHILTMCVRALDYCPPLDLTFGEYLRAVITADQDVYPEDGRNYRVAYVEAFRRRGLFPRNLRTLSVDNLPWRGPDNDELKPSAKLLAIIVSFRNLANEQLYSQTRKDLFRLERKGRLAIHAALDKHFKTDPEGPHDAEFLGLDGTRSFQVSSAHFPVRIDPDGPFVQLVAQIIQRTSVPADENDPNSEPMEFEGGSTLIADLNAETITYCVRKPAKSETRLQRQRSYVRDKARALRATYFSTDEQEAREPFALLHRGYVGVSDAE
jgi:hypothetical protein